MLEAPQACKILGCEQEAPYLRKFGKLSIQESFVMTSPYVRKYDRTDSVGRGK